MTRIVMIILSIGLLSTTLSFADSLELQQMKQTIRMLEENNVPVPQSMRDAVQQFEEMEKKSGTVDDSDNTYGKSLSQMNCTDDISGTWISGLTTMTLSSDGQAKLRTDDATGQYYTLASFNWSSGPSTFTADYNYVRTFNSRTGKVERETQPPTDTVKCRYMGNMLDIGGVLYSH